MRHYQETLEDKATLVVGGAIFTIVATLTAAVMAVGFAPLELVYLLRHRS